MFVIEGKADIAIQGRHVRSTNIGFVVGFGSMPINGNSRQNLGTVGGWGGGG
jgi:hypothetical protein